MKTISYPAHGWLRPGAHLQWQRADQGRDFVSDWDGIIQAPGSGYCVRNGDDRPFPNGFGPRYAIVFIESGAFAGHEWYIGHCSSLLSPGERFAFGHALARINQGRPGSIGVHAPFNGGWVELGEAFGGSPGRMASWHWYDPILFRPLKIRVPGRALKEGMSGRHVYAMTGRLRDCGYFARPYWRFTALVRKAVIAFQHHHHLPADGVVGPHTQHTLGLAAHWCRVHHKRKS